MKLAKDFLDRFKKLTPPHQSIRAVVARAISTSVGSSLSHTHISIAHGVAFIKASSPLKSLIRSRRGDILEQIYEELPQARDSVRDLR